MLSVAVLLVIINVVALQSDERYTAPNWTPEPGTEGDWEEEPKN